MTSPDPFTVTLDIEDAEAIAVNIMELLDRDNHPDHSLWGPILDRLRASIAQADSLI